VSPLDAPRSTSSRAFGAVIAIDLMIVYGYHLFAGG
jgi:hypothetical protein